MMKIIILTLLLIASQSATANPAKEVHSEFHNTVELKAGNFMGGVDGTGLIGGWLLDRKSSIEASLMNGILETKRNPSESLFFGSGDVQVLQFQASYKRFWGNSFYTNLGLGYRKVDAGFLLGGSVVLVEEEFAGDAIEVITQIGNQWTLGKRFLLGIDWLGFSQPVISNSSTQLRSNGLSESEADDIYHDGQRLSKTLTSDGYFSVAMIRIGVGF